jgi:hypothetical protein
MRRFVGFILLLFLFSACAEKKQEAIEVPEVLIAKDKMAEILSEVQLVEAYINQIPYSKRGKSDTDYVYFPMLFEKYQISKTDFLENLAYYSTNEKTISSIYEKSIILLNKVKAKDLEIRLEMKMDSIRQDSIQSVLEEIKLDSIAELDLEFKKTKK